jgi:hypothetical protein
MGRKCSTHGGYAKSTRLFIVNLHVKRPFARFRRAQQNNKMALKKLGWQDKSRINVAKEGQCPVVELLTNWASTETPCSYRMRDVTKYYLNTLC